MRFNIKIWNELKSELGLLSLKYGNKKDLYTIIASWVLKNIKYFQENELDIKLGLSKYASYNPNEYSVEYTEDTLDETIEWLGRLEKNSYESIAMTTRDVLWDMLAYKSKINCPVCEDDLRVLQDPKSKNIILTCDTCAWTQYENGKQWSGENILKPANIYVLKERGYIPHHES